MTTDHPERDAADRGQEILPTDLLRDEKGAVFVEYLVLSLFVTIGGAGAVMVLGVPLLRLYHWGNAWITFPLP